jgi:hypothetical protein
MNLWTNVSINTKVSVGHSGVPAFCIWRLPLQSEVLMNESDGHAAFAHSTRYSFDGVMPHVTSREHARQAGLQRVIQE